MSFPRELCTSRGCSKGGSMETIHLWGCNKGGSSVSELEQLNSSFSCHGNHWESLQCAPALAC
jgi:hypothetical protein